MDILKYDDYLNSCSLTTVANTIVFDLKKTVIEKNIEKPFLIGFHIRHFLDSTSPTYVAGHSNNGFEEEINKIIKENKETGKHTFNHLIDALYYHKGERKRKALVDKDAVIHTQISFTELKSNTNVAVDENFDKNFADITLSNFSSDGLDSHEHFF